MFSSCSQEIFFLSDFHHTKADIHSTPRTRDPNDNQPTSGKCSLSSLLPRVMTLLIFTVRSADECLPASDATRLHFPLPTCGWTHSLPAFCVRFTTHLPVSATTPSCLIFHASLSLWGPFLTVWPRVLVTTPPSPPLFSWNFCS